MYDVIVIGGGPAGLAASVYLARQKMKFALIAETIGGQTLWSSEVENYLGFHLINGMDLVQKFKDHLKDYAEGFTMKEGDRVTNVVQRRDGFEVTTRAGETFEATAVLVATGEKHRELGIPREKQFYGRGVTYCATCDAPLYQGKIVVVVGGGNSAMEAATFLEKYATHVTIITVNDALKGDAMLQKRIEASKKITVITKAKTTKVSGDSFVRALEVECDGKLQVIPTEGIFIEIGLIPISEMIGFVKKNQKGEIEVNEKNETSVPGVWAAGDVTNVTEKQIAVAVGEGSKAALQIIRWLGKMG